MDYFHNQAIVAKQYDVYVISSRARAGEKVTRDQLHRFVYTQI